MEDWITEHCDNVSCQGFQLLYENLGSAKHLAMLAPIHSKDVTDNGDPMVTINVCDTCEDTLVSSGDWVI